MNDNIDDLLATDPDDIDVRHWSPTPGSEFHALRTGATIRTGVGPAGFDGHSVTRGEVFVITDAMLDANRNRFGESWLDLIDDEDGQFKNWGERRYAPGRPSASMQPWMPGSVEEAEAREEARQAAWRIQDAQERAAARAAVEKGFGRLVTSQTIAEYDEHGQMIRRAR